ncbi:hypothetical protein ACNTMW_04080 [Planosporangium sp. 12N6]|uniref:hypothetical protein n=1 Tax=Planosporangium spinosum TaxID=3402278 RepID=UPI003CF7EE75
MSAPTTSVTAPTTPAGPPRGARLLAAAMLAAPLGYLGALCLYAVARTHATHAELLTEPVDPKDFVPGWLLPGYVLVFLAVTYGQLPALLLLLAGAPHLAVPRVRARRGTWWLVLVAALATCAYLVVSVTPFGFALNQWILD